MLHRPTIQGMTTSVLSLSVWLTLQGRCAPLAADDKPRAESAAAPDSAEATAAADDVRKLVAQMQVRGGDARPDESLQPQGKPLLTYNDLARGYLAAGVWRLGARGRPAGLVSVEYWLRSGDGQSDQPYLSYEFLSFAGRPMELVSPADGFTWRGDGNTLQFTGVSDTSAPAETARQRLIQMKGI